MENEQGKEAIVYPHTVVLKTPVTFGDEYIENIVVQNEPTAKQIFSMPIGGNQKMEDYCEIVAGVIGKPTAFVEMLSAKDYFDLVSLVTDFLTD